MINLKDIETTEEILRNSVRLKDFDRKFVYVDDENGLPDGCRITIRHSCLFDRDIKLLYSLIDKYAVYFYIAYATTVVLF